MANSTDLAHTPRSVSDSGLDCFRESLYPYAWCEYGGPKLKFKVQGPVVQSVFSLTSSLRVISLTVLADSIYNILIFFAEKNVSSFSQCKSYSHFFSKKLQHICVSLNVNFNESLTNDVVSFEQLALFYEYYMPMRGKQRSP